MSMRKYGANSFKRPMTEETEMSEVKRFKPVINSKPYKPYAFCEENEEGIYVRIHDYAALKAERDKLAAENLALKILADACSLEYESAATQGCGDDEKVAYPEDSCNITFGMIRRAIKTPATDAYANKLRAEGADSVAEYHRERAEFFKNDKRGKAYFPHAVAMLDAQTVAASLRKENGND